MIFEDSIKKILREFLKYYYGALSDKFTGSLTFHFRDGKLMDTVDTKSTIR